MEPVIRKINKHGNERWEIDYGLDSMGERKRPVYLTEPAAKQALEDWRTELKTGGEFWAGMTPQARREAVSVLQEIKEAGRTPREIWEDWKRWRKENSQTCVEPRPYEEAVATWEERKRSAGKDERYIQDGASLLRKFGVGRERQNIHEISHDDLELWVASQKGWKSASSKKTNTSIFSSLWEVAVSKGWCSQNICDRLEPITRPSPEVRIYPNDIVLLLMAAALSNEATQTVIAELSLGLFGCMRPEEIQSVKALRNGLTGKKLFGWHDIDLKTRRVTVRKEIAKTGDQRTVRLQPTGWEWLMLAKKLGSDFPPQNERKLVDQCCELIGLDDWLRDGLRKCCATHLRNVYKNDYDVTLDMGNSVRVLLKHYAALHVPPEQSAEYWAITPDNVREYMKSDKWKKHLLRVSAVRRER
jgi:hypothetical protein